MEQAQKKICNCDASGWPATSRIGTTCEDCGGTVIDGDAAKRKKPPSCKYCIFCDKPFSAKAIVVNTTWGNVHEKCWNSHTYNWRRDKLKEIADAMA